MHPDRWLMPKPQPTTGPKDPVAKPAAPVKVGPDPDYGVTVDDMEALRQRHVERAQDGQMRGEMAFAHFLGQAPSLVAAMQKLKDRG